MSKICRVKKYWDKGLKTLPVKEDKSPHGGVRWREDIPKDISLYEDAYGVAVACGSASGGLECLDFDNHFDDAQKTIKNFQGIIKDLFKQHKFPIETTPHGGFHLFFRCEKNEGNRKLANKKAIPLGGDKEKVSATIETRGEGGYVIVDPTEGYKFFYGSLENVPVISIEDRDRLIEAAMSLNEYVEDKFPIEEEKGNKPGDLFNRDPNCLEEVKNCLLKHEWTEVKDKQWRRPDKKKGISATLGVAAENVFYVFSSNAHPFDVGGYSPFRVIGLLDYGGDFKRWAAELFKRYEKELPQKKEYGTQQEKSHNDTELESILSKAYIDYRIPVVRPPVVMKIRNNGEQRLMSLGNFSAIIGKSKSKKTFFVSILGSAAVSNEYIQGKIKGCLPEGKRGVLWFDTEQSDYDAYRTAKRVIETTGKDQNNFYAYDLREYSPRDRCQIIDYALQKYKNYAGYVVIDGIADLVTAINDEEEASRVVSLLMKWTKIYNCHITTVIHQNKHDSFATGHLGSSVMKKSECVISVTKNEDFIGNSTVGCDYIRGVREFDSFDFSINEDGYPIISGSSESPINKDIPF